MKTLARLRALAFGGDMNLEKTTKNATLLRVVEHCEEAIKDMKSGLEDWE